MSAKRKKDRSKPKPLKRCGLCGKWNKLTRTECCGNWICNDEHKYVMFTYAHNSCHRNHDRYTLCATHHNEEHDGDWKTCQICRDEIELEMYVWYGTNEYNFEKLENPPEFSPTHCAKCNRVIRLALEGYSMTADGYVCSDCLALDIPDFSQ